MDMERPETEVNDEIKLGRVGHYSIREVCQTALITDVLPEAFDSETGKLPQRVNVAGWSKDGDAFSRRGVLFGVSQADEGEFHLNRDCPEHR